MMQHTRFYQKRILLASLVLVFILIVSWLLFFSMPDQSVNKQESDRLALDTSIGRVYINDYHKLQGSDIEGLQEKIENILYNRASNKGDDPDLYTATIRESSYERNSINNVTTTTFLVDVRPVEVTYRISVTTLQGNSSIVVSCAPEEKQKNASAVCEDSEYYL